MKFLKLIPIIFLLAACNTETSSNVNSETVTTTEASKIELNATEVSISNAWVREPAPGQKIGAAYMTLNSAQTSKLVYAEAADTAGSVEIHSMSMNNGVMKMRMLDELTLEANTPKELAPGGFHLMMFDLKKPLKAGEEVAFRLCFEDVSGNITHQNVTLAIKSQ
ncbi:MAG: copper chaperone PCu(A)C [Methylophilaceae bacterium]